MYSQSDFDYCKDEFKEFLKINYSSDDITFKEHIEEFCINFCFDDLYDTEKINDKDEENRNKYIEFSYGSNSKDARDCDDTHLARVLLFLVHADRENNEYSYSIPLLNNFIEIGSGYRYKYRGDTINTYSTLFGSGNQGYKKFFPKNEEIEKFRRKYLTIGNFILFPALSVQLDEKKRKWDSINTFRGTNEHYRDFFDLFLYKFLTENKDFEPWKNNPDKEEYIDEYFKVMKDENEFIKRNILELYCPNGELTSNYFGHTDTEAPFYWWIENIDENKYRDFAIKYIRKATEIINYRAEKICEILKNIYSE